MGLFLTTQPVLYHLRYFQENYPQTEVHSSYFYKSLTSVPEEPLADFPQVVLSHSFFDYLVNEGEEWYNSATYRFPRTEEGCCLAFLLYELVRRELEHQSEPTCGHDDIFYSFEKQKGIVCRLESTIDFDIVANGVSMPRYSEVLAQISMLNRKKLEDSISQYDYIHEFGTEEQLKQFLINVLKFAYIDVVKYCRETTLSYTICIGDPGTREDIFEGSI